MWQRRLSQSLNALLCSIHNRYKIVAFSAAEIMRADELVRGCSPSGSLFTLLNFEIDAHNGTDNKSKMMCMLFIQQIVKWFTLHFIFSFGLFLFVGK